MNPFALAFTLVAGIAMLVLRREWAIAPLLASACYMTMGQEVGIGGAHFTVVRLIIAAGVLRVIVRGEWRGIRLSGLDVAVAAWVVLAVWSSFFHKPLGDALRFRLGYSYTGGGLYLLFRIFVQTPADFDKLCRIVVLMLVPVAVLMLGEKLTGRNPFAVFGGVPDVSLVREGKIRAQGPFAVYITAGTAGASILPFAVYLWRDRRWLAWLGLFSSVAIVFSSASSGPIMTLLVAMAGMCLWRYRVHLRTMVWAGVLTLCLLELVMESHVWYLMGRVDLVGGSTGWHRAELISQAFGHLSEWWWAGTDYTRHWMPTGVTWSEDHTDITNQFIKMGVLGGLPLMGVFVLVLLLSFRACLRALRQIPNHLARDQFGLWCLWSVLLAHAATFFSLSYFDQVQTFFWLPVAVAGSLAGFYALHQEDEGISPATQGNVGTEETVGEGTAARSYPLGG